MGGIHETSEGRHPAGEVGLAMQTFVAKNALRHDMRVARVALRTMYSNRPSGRISRMEMALQSGILGRIMPNDVALFRHIHQVSG